MTDKTWTHSHFTLVMVRTDRHTYRHTVGANYGMTLRDRLGLGYNIQHRGGTIIYMMDETMTVEQHERVRV